jgi:hypothetical protein
MDESPEAVRNLINRQFGGLCHWSWDILQHDGELPAIYAVWPQDNCDQPVIFTLALLPGQDIAAWDDRYKLVRQMALAHNAFMIANVAEAWEASEEDPGEPYVRPRDSDRRREIVTAGVFIRLRFLTCGAFSIREILRGPDGKISGLGQEEVKLENYSGGGMRSRLMECMPRKSVKP